MVEDGEIHALTKRKAEVPEEVATFMRLPGLGPKTARRIWKELGITTVAGLRAAAEAQQLRDLAGLGAKSEERILAALAKPQATEGPRRALLGAVCRSCARSPRRWRRIRRRSRCRSRARPGASARPSATST